MSDNVGMTNDTAPVTILTIRGREYTVERNPHRTDQYLLTGKKGAVYGTVREANGSGRMFIMGARSAGTLAGVWLTDVDGTLRVAE